MLNPVYPLYFIGGWYNECIDSKINVDQKLKVVLQTEDRIVGKKENAGYQHYILFPQCFQQASFGVAETQNCVAKSNVKHLPAKMRSSE